MPEGTRACAEPGLDGDHGRAPRGGRADLVLDRYRLGQRLGAGGFGTVYAATDERLQRPVAVKVIPSGASGDPSAGAARRWPPAASTIPGIVAVFDAGEDERARYLVSELVYGRTVDELSAEGVLSDRDVLRIGLALVRRAQPRARPRRRPPRRQAAERDDPRRAALGGGSGQARRLRRRAPGRRRAADAHRRRRRHARLHGARAGRRASGSTTAATSTASRSCSTRRWRGSTRCAPAPPPRRRAASAPSSAAAARAQGPAGGAVRRDRPRAASEARRARDARRPRRRARGLAARGLRRGRHGRAAPARAHRAVRRCRAASPAPPPRCSAGGLCAAALAVGGAADAPRARRRRARSRCCRGSAGSPRRSRRSRVLAVERPGRRGARRRRARPRPAAAAPPRHAWSVPALAPLLGLATLAGAYPALAGQARGPLTRAALGALGAWWALLAAPLLGARDPRRRQPAPADRRTPRSTTCSPRC